MGENGLMDREYCLKMCKEKKRLFITLKGGRVFSGTIESVGTTSIVILDKFNEEVQISLDNIGHIESERKIDGQNGGNYGTRGH